MLYDGVGDRILRLLSVYYNTGEGLVTSAARAAITEKTPFRSERGVTQGDQVSPVIFNVVVDCVVRQRASLARVTSYICRFYVTNDDDI